MNAHSSFINRHCVALYFGIVYLLAWAVWIPLVIARHGTAGEQVNLSLTLLAGAAPCISATFVAWAAFGREGVKRLWQRLIRWQIGLRWYLAAFFVPAALLIAATVLIVLFKGPPVGYLANFQPIGLLTGLLLYIPMAVFEEVGWRGFAQPGLQKNLSALGACAILGIGWSFWHFPYFLIPEFSFFSLDALQGFLSGFAIYSLGTIPTCILIAWLFNNSDGSLILPCIFHGANNVFAGTFLIPLIQANGTFALALSTGVSTFAAAVVLIVFGYHRLTRRPFSSENLAFGLVPEAGLEHSVSGVMS